MQINNKEIDLLKPLIVILISLIVWIYTTDRADNEKFHDNVSEDIKVMHDQQIELNAQQKYANNYMQNMDARQVQFQQRFEKFYNENKRYWAQENKYRGNNQ